MFDPDDVADGYSRGNIEEFMKCFIVFLVILVFLEFFYIVYLKFKESKNENNKDVDNETCNKEQENNDSEDKPKEEITSLNKNDIIIKKYSSSHELLENRLQKCFIVLTLITLVLIVIQGLTPIFVVHFIDRSNDYIFFEDYHNISIYNFFDPQNYTTIYDNVSIDGIGKQWGIITFIPLVFILIGFIIAIIAFIKGIQQTIKFYKFKDDEKCIEYNSCLALGVVGFIFMVLGASLITYSSLVIHDNEIIETRLYFSILGGIIVTFIICIFALRFAYSIVTNLKNDKLRKIVLNNVINFLASLFVIVIMLSLCNGFITGIYGSETSSYKDSGGVIIFIRSYMNSFSIKHQKEMYTLSSEEAKITLYYIGNLVVYICLLVTLAIVSYKVIKEKDKHNKIHIKSSIILSVILLIYIISILITGNNETFFNGDNSGYFKPSIGVIISFIFSLLLVGINIAWYFFNKKVINKNTSDEVLA